MSPGTSYPSAASHTRSSSRFHLADAGNRTLCRKDFTKHIILIPLISIRLLKSATFYPDISPVSKWEWRIREGVMRRGVGRQDSSMPLHTGHRKLINAQVNVHSPMQRMRSEFRCHSEGSWAISRSPMSSGCPFLIFLIGPRCSSWKEVEW